jgi:hypothetical protein
MASIIPAAKALTLRDYHVGYRDGKVDLYGLLNAIRPGGGLPHAVDRFCVFAQLINGLGEVSFFVDVRYGPTDELVRNTDVRQLRFPDRSTLV